MQKILSPNSSHLVHYRNPGHLDQVRAEKLCHLNVYNHVIARQLASAKSRRRRAKLGAEAISNLYRTDFEIASSLMLLAKTRKSIQPERIATLCSSLSTDRYFLFLFKDPCLLGPKPFRLSKVTVRFFNSIHPF